MARSDFECNLLDIRLEQVLCGALHLGAFHIFVVKRKIEHAPLAFSSEFTVTIKWLVIVHIKAKERMHIKGKIIKYPRKFTGGGGGETKSVNCRNSKYLASFKSTFALQVCN